MLKMFSFPIALSVIGCSPKVEPSLLARIGEQKLELTISNNGQILSKRALDLSSQKQLVEWYKNHQNNWQGSMTSYAPKVTVQGLDFSITFQKQRAILNATVEGKPIRQTVLEVTSTTDLPAFVREAINSL